MEEHPVFTYQLKSNLEELIALVDKLPGIIPDEIKTNSDVAFSGLKSHIKKSKLYLEAHQEELTQFQAKACDLYDEAYNKIKAKKASIDFKLKTLTTLPEIKCNIPYNFKELVEMSEKLGKLSDSEFDRVVDLAKAFAGK